MFGAQLRHVLACVGRGGAACPRADATGGAWNLLGESSALGERRSSTCLCPSGRALVIGSGDASEYNLAQLLSL